MFLHIMNQFNILRSYLFVWSIDTEGSRRRHRWGDQDRLWSLLFARRYADDIQSSSTRVIERSRVVFLSLAFPFYSSKHRYPHSLSEIPSLLTVPRDVEMAVEKQSSDPTNDVRRRHGGLVCARDASLRHHVWNNFHGIHWNRNSFSFFCVCCSPPGVGMRGNSWNARIGGWPTDWHHVEKSRCASVERRRTK